jgi:hypothetical protein
VPENDPDRTPAVTVPSAGNEEDGKGNDDDCGSEQRLPPVGRE